MRPLGALGRLALGVALFGAGKVLGRLCDLLEPEPAQRADPEPVAEFRCVCGLSFVHGGVFATHVIARHPQLLPPGLLSGRTP